MSYATVDDLAGYVETVPTTATVLLERASRDVDQALLTAIYDVDDVDVQAALRIATCEQAAGYIAAGRRAGVGGAVQSFSIGRVSVSKASAGSSSGPAEMVGDLYRQAHLALAAEPKLSRREPWTY